MSKRKDDLGKGIRALLQDIGEESEGFREATPDTDTPLNAISEVPLEEIEVNPFQPRASFDQEALEELAASIRVHGIIQPITVRKLGPGKYQLIAGERRLRASKIAGLKSIPAYVRLASDQEALEIALIENIQREDLNPMEIAINYQRLIDECSLTHEDLGTRLGKERSTVTNYLRLLRLPPEIQKGLKERKLSMGHARALISIPEVDRQLFVYRAILHKGLSVRATEEMVRNLDKVGDTHSKAHKRTPSLPQAYEYVRNRLMDRLETKVQIKKGSGEKGEIVIPFYSTNDLNRLIDLIEGED